MIEKNDDSFINPENESNFINNDRTKSYNFPEELESIRNLSIISNVRTEFSEPEDFIQQINYINNNINNDKIDDNNISKPIIIIQKENELEKFCNFFPKIKTISDKEILNQIDTDKNLYNKFDLIFCRKQFLSNGGLKCEPEKEICPTCMIKNQKYHCLKKHYLINSAGRVCTIKNKMVYCLFHFNRIIEINNISYHVEMICGHGNQCQPCERMTKLIDHYIDNELMKGLIARDKLFFQ